MDAPVHVRIVPRDTIIIVTGWIVVPTLMPRTRIGTQKVTEVTVAEECWNHLLPVLSKCGIRRYAYTTASLFCELFSIS